MVQVNDRLRISRMEAVYSQLRADMDDVMRAAYEKAVEERDEATAAAIARKIRNSLLDRSDKECTLDKMLPAAPEGSTFSAWLGWLRQFAGIAHSDWAVYRQSLRDLTEQEGFPFNIVWPVAPNEVE